MNYFKKILVANRGEIAVRVIRAAKLHNIRIVAVYASDDLDSLHVSLADQSVLLQGNTLAETYLNQDKMIEIALAFGVEAIHPGYGFLSENAGFAKKVSDSGLVFIGPSPENISLMGEKNQALEFVRDLGIPLLPSYRGSLAELLSLSSEMNFPVMVKASGGGGGKGMLICNSADDLPEALKKAERQALDYFGNGELFVEKYLPKARHIEVQLMADHFGKVLHFYERECSVQRRFQKIIEEAPSPSVSEKLRVEITEVAVKIAQSMNYRNAGTIEFLLDENSKFYFLEMNTRIQVEHPVTELITNTDLVSLQLLVAAGNPLHMAQEEIQISGHAIEVRVCAEDAENNFKPSAGQLALWRMPDMQSLRIETFVQEGIRISSRYDSLLAKLIVFGENREKAILRMQNCLSETAVSGIHTNLPFLAGLLESDEFNRNEIYTRYVDENLNQINGQIHAKREDEDQFKLAIAYLYIHFLNNIYTGNSVWNQIGYWRIYPVIEVFVDGNKCDCQVESGSGIQQIKINGQIFQTTLHKNRDNKLEIEINGKAECFYFHESESETIILSGGFAFPLKSNQLLKQVTLNRKNMDVERVFQNLICADLFGKVLKLNVHKGDLVNIGDVLLTLESMKTEIHVLSPVNARIKKVHVTEGNVVVEKQLLVEMETPSTSFEHGKKNIIFQ